MPKRLNQKEIRRMIGRVGGGRVGGGSLDPSSLGGYATMAWTEENYLSKAFWSELFIIHKKETTVVVNAQSQEISRVVRTSEAGQVEPFSPNEVPGSDSSEDSETGYTTTTTTEVNSIQAKKGFWTSYFLSALGLNSSSSGGGATALTDLVDVAVTQPQTGQALIYNATTGKWENGDAGMNMTALENYLVSKVLTVKNGQTTLGTWNPTAAGAIDISSALTGFLKHVEVGDNDLTGLSGSFFFGGNGTLKTNYDYVGFQAGNNLDRWQMVVLDDLQWRQNDSENSPSAGWGTWNTIIDSANYATQLAGKVTNAMLVNSQMTINGTAVSLGGNVTTSKWGTARTVTISDYDGTNTQATTNIDGSGNFTLKLPSTIKATADAATKLTTISKTIWGQTYWTSNGVPDNVDGKMTINYSGSTAEMITLNATGSTYNCIQFNGIGNGAAWAIGNHSDNFYFYNSSNGQVFSVGVDGSVNDIISIELNSNGILTGFGGFVDFHYGGNYSDYSSRIIETSAGVIDFRANSLTTGITAKAMGLKVGADYSGSGSYVQIGGIRIEYDSTNNALKVVQSDGSTAANFYATGGVSALGMSSSGSGSASYLSDLGDVYLSSPSNGQALVYRSGYWRNETIQSGGGSGTVTSVGMTVPTGFSVSGSPVTGSGTLAVSFANGYSLPTTTKQTNWDTAYGWGDHSAQGYIKHVEVSTNNLNGYSGSFFFGGENTLMSNYDYVGFQAGNNSDRWQMVVLDKLKWRQNDSPNSPASGWTNWYTVLDSNNTYVSSGKGYINGTAITTITGNAGSADYATSAGTASSASSATTASKLSTTSKTIWGQTYWTSGGIPTNVDGRMTINYSGSAAEMITLNATGSTYNCIQFNRIGSGAAWAIGNDSSTFYMYNSSSGSVFTVSQDGSVSKIISLELNSSGNLSGFGGFIDFHYNGSSSDYTSRIIESTAGVVKIDSAYTPTLQIGNIQLVYDSSNNAIKLQTSSGGAANFYTLGGISALGISSNSSGKISGSLVPSVNGDYNLGSSSYGWYTLNLANGSNRAEINVDDDGDLNFYNYGGKHYFNTGVSFSGTGYFSGKVSIAGTNTNSDKLYVNGSVRASSYNNTSDARLKDIISNEDIDLETIARAPIVRFKWKDSDDPRVHWGTLAQYWRGTEISDIVEGGDYLSMDYAATALASVISVARRVVEHEERIKRLEAAVAQQYTGQEMAA